MKKKEVAKKPRNFVIKHSINKSGAGSHKSVKDYKRKSKNNDKLEET